ncbi:dUTP diphosphatase [Aerococcus kribbianus]|uniref:dUTP diphosphatase n=1 Tax=Aerococcus kribbianus TaxID=2999064 RepID=A0A9X3JGE1_9LACT|nr:MULTISPECIES: dUTP diphosphatase [unclassified Aerococcus]MCZ0717968.1 dUTP diphosphatase [Aerococcus sp. YH-aer221]MCZ0726255.1 dUTP diphosphatase [Aerococcus sp. YH-aer222]
MAQRGFEFVSTYADQGLNLPMRQTSGSAGYDIAAAEDVTIPSIWQRGVMATLLMSEAGKSNKDWQTALEKAPAIKPVLVATGIKAYMPQDEYLQLTCRSSNPLKRSLILPNGVGIIDSDYYGNNDNEGHIYVQLLNFGLEDVHIKKGDRIAQGIFLSYQKTDQDIDNGVKRQGGFGSSGQN